METRIQQALDGELTRGELTEAELADLEEAEASFAAVVRAVPVGPLPPLGASVLNRVAAAESRPLSRSPVRPLAFAGWLVAAGLALMLFTGKEQPRAPAQVLVEFRLDAPQAHQVSLAGGFTNWKPTYSLVRGEPGVWTIVVPLDPGVHDYAFIVDGERWVPDPQAPAIADGFGGLNSRVAVLAPDAET